MDLQYNGQKFIKKKEKKTDNGRHNTRRKLNIKQDEQTKNGVKLLSEGYERPAPLVAPFLLLLVKIRG